MRPPRTPFRHRARPARFAITLAVALCACGPSTAQRPTRTSREHVTSTDRGRPTTDTPATTLDTRALGAAATFADLVHAARTLEDRGDANSSARCLLRGTGEVGASWRLEADIAVAVRPLPAPWDDYDAHLRAHRGPVRLLSRWGQTRAEPYALALATFTSTVPVDATRAAALVALTNEGAHVVGTTPGAMAAGAPMPLARVAEALRALQPSGTPALIALTAEAEVPLASVREMLALLAELGVPVALAVPLAPDVRLPAEPPVAPDAAERGLCGRGLPEPPPSATEGDLAESAVIGALTPLREAAARCLTVASGRAASGGRLDVTLRIGADGAVTEACTLRDELLDPALRMCVLEAARALRFPVPSPAGYVDIVLPLRLAADASLAQRPLCP